MKKAVFLIASLFFFSCSKKAEVLDFKIYPSGKFKALLIDFHLTEAALSLNLTITDSAARSAVQTYDLLLDKYETTKEEALKNLNYYSSRPDDFIVIMEEVVDSLNVMNLSLR